MRDVHFTILLGFRAWSDFMNFELWSVWHTRSVTNIITSTKFLISSFRSYGVLTTPEMYLPLTYCIVLSTVYTMIHC